MDNPYDIKLVIIYLFTFLTAKPWKCKLLLKWECIRQYSWLVREAPPTQKLSVTARLTNLALYNLYIVQPPSCSGPPH